jgi:hypothetical protein
MSRFQALRQNFPLGALALEVFSIVLGVGLALAAGQWVESRREAERTRESLQVLASEIERNQELVLLRLGQRHELDLDLYTAISPVYAGEPRIRIDSLSHLELGIFPFNTAAYQTIVSNGTLANLNIDTNVQLTAAYTLLETTMEIDRELRQQLSRMDFYDMSVRDMSDPSETANALRAMLSLSYQLKRNERGLLRSHRDLLRRLGAQGISVDTLTTPVDSLGLPSSRIKEARRVLIEEQRTALEARAQRRPDGRGAERRTDERVERTNQSATNPSPR